MKTLHIKPCIASNDLNGSNYLKSELATPLIGSLTKEDYTHQWCWQKTCSGKRANSVTWQGGYDQLVLQAEDNVLYVLVERKSKARVSQVLDWYIALFPLLDCFQKILQDRPESTTLKFGSCRSLFDTRWAADLSSNVSLWVPGGTLHQSSVHIRSQGWIMMYIYNIIAYI